MERIDGIYLIKHVWNQKVNKHVNVEIIFVFAELQRFKLQ